MNLERNGSPRVAGIGEVLWDVFPEHRRLGGAPANFACHCAQLGADAVVVSCVGADDAGEQILAALRALGTDTGLIARSSAHPTGTVQVTLGADGSASYQIREDVAWDHLPLTDQLVAAAARSDAACFGTLAQRSATSRDTIRALVDAMPAGARRIYDVNLRPPFFSKALVSASLDLATVLKLSDEELPVLAGFFDLHGTPRAQLAALRERFGLELVACTRGAHGSLLVSADEVDDTPGVPVEAVDPVGAGDSFTAALCMGLLWGWPLPRINRFANEVARFVCQQPGATPVLPARLIPEPARRA